ncbi:MFS transporter, DHA1 family, tetracycline resistance protein [Dyadobacter koreensis]|uniref:MFS transporter, DHA1 family, tetracycline resistance protein n=1 Tax=Dyadobacter koreensis TaxID=408657 RepID=A0A1H6WDL7_9BACT|nr:TCR/Tet family MFS transporter [Dyadobacter koreensis]SEJ15111.1 MFS transporter, DHA1 family, tetracycline resistance protein [Dyadobacter koreensis]
MTSKKSPAIGFIFITLLIDVMGLGIIIPVMPKLISELVGGSLSDAARYGGWILFSYSFVQFVCAPIVGGLSDQFGRRPVLLASLLGFALDYLFVAYAPSIVWLFVGRIIAGVMGASFTTGAAYIADVSTPEKRAQNFGLIGAAFGLGFIIGPVLGGLLGQYGSRVPFLAAAGLSMLNFLYGLFILPESLKQENRRKFSWKRASPIGALKHLQKYPVISGLIISLALLYVAMHAVQSNWSYYTMEKFQWNERIIGYSLGAMGLLGAIVQGGLIRLIIPKIGQKRGVYVGLFLYSVGFVLFAFARETWMMFAFMVPYILGGIAGPSLQGIISTQVPSNEQGELQGALTSLMSLTSIIGPPLMSNLFYFFTKSEAPVYFPGAPMLTAAVLTLLSAYLARKSLKSNF